MSAPEPVGLGEPAPPASAWLTRGGPQSPAWGAALGAVLCLGLGSALGAGGLLHGVLVLLGGLTGSLLQSAQARRQTAARREAALRQALSEAAGRALWTSGPGNTAWLSDGFWDDFGIPAGRCPSLAPWLDRIHPEDLGPLLHGLTEVRRGETASLRQTCRLVPAGESSEQPWWIDVYARRLDSPEGEALVGSIADVTVQHQMTERLTHTAFHDALTGLPNRALFLDRLAHSVARARRNPRYRFALVYLDIDEFKVINDSLGHTAGDALLTIIAARLQASVRPGDTVARIGGDEFTVLLDPVAHLADAERIARRVSDSTRGPTCLHNHVVEITTSVGVAYAGDEHSDPHDLMRDADTAMYQAKQAGPGLLRIFDKAMHDTAMRRLQVETELRQALDTGRLEAHYQPIICLRTGAIEGFEALARLTATTGGPIPPDEFIPLAESLGLVDAVFEAIIRDATLRLNQWGPLRPDLYVSVNLSARSLRAGFVERLSALLGRCKLAPTALKLELTESAFVGGNAEAAEVLATLKALGIGLYIDDFGTGYSSLSYLHQLPVDHIKLDRGFVAALDGQRTPEIVETIITLSRRLGAAVIAEGIETAAQLAVLRSLGCASGQGFLFAPALTPEAATRLLEEGRAWPVSTVPPEAAPTETPAGALDHENRERISAP